MNAVFEEIIKSVIATPASMSPKLIALNTAALYPPSAYTTVTLTFISFEL